MGANEIEAARSYGTIIGPLLLVALALIPALIPLLRREREKPHNPIPQIVEEITAMKRRIDEVEKVQANLPSQFHEHRRDIDSLNRQFEVWKAVQQMDRRP